MGPAVQAGDDGTLGQRWGVRLTWLMDQVRPVGLLHACHWSASLCIFRHPRCIHILYLIQCLDSRASTGEPKVSQDCRSYRGTACVPPSKWILSSAHLLFPSRLSAPTALGPTPASISPSHDAGCCCCRPTSGGCHTVFFLHPLQPPAIPRTACYDATHGPLPLTGDCKPRGSSIPTPRTSELGREACSVGVLAGKGVVLVDLG